MANINLKTIVLWQAENKLIEKLREFGVLPTELECSSGHGKTKMDRSEEGGEVWFRCKEYKIDRQRKRVRCNTKVSEKAASVFCNAQLSYEQILIMLHEWLNYSEVRKMSIEASVETGKTAALWNAFFNEVAINWCIDNSTQIGEKILTKKVFPFKMSIYVFSALNSEINLTLFL